MEPIISPWLIYVIGQVDKIEGVCFLFAMLAGIASVISTIFWVGNAHEPAVTVAKKVSRIAYPLFIFLIIPFVVIPSSKTIIGMVVAQNVTTDNVCDALKFGEDIKETLKADVFEIIEAIQEREEK